MYGEPHNPIFVSFVDIEGKIFVGEEAKRKKEAKLNAAKAAYRAFSGESVFFFFFFFTRRLISYFSSDIWYRPVDFHDQAEAGDEE